MSAPVLVTLALAGGQGKTTIALMMGRYFGRCGIPVLFVDWIKIWFSILQRKLLIPKDFSNKETLSQRLLKLYGVQLFVVPSVPYSVSK